MKEVKPKQCICGKYPETKKEVAFYGGGRYKAATRSEWWESNCRGCYRGHEHAKSQEGAIVAWNKGVMEDRKRRDTKDKLVYDLEHNQMISRYDTNVKAALARLLREVGQIREQLNKKEKR